MDQTNSIPYQAISQLDVKSLVLAYSLNWTTDLGRLAKTFV